MLTNKGFRQFSLRHYLNNLMGQNTLQDESTTRVMPKSDLIRICNSFFAGRIPYFLRDASMIQNFVCEKPHREI
jgi:hypothetical protein